MALDPLTQSPKYAIEQGTFRGLLTGATPTIGTLNSDTNGVIVCPAVTNGSRIVALYGMTTDTVTVNVFLYGFTASGHVQGSNFIRPIGLVNIPLSSANTFAARVHVDMLSPTNLPGIEIDPSSRKPFILLGRGEALKATSLANLTASAICVISGAKFDYLG
jgi:hypothetical protein